MLDGRSELLGRTRECAAIDRLLDRARAGHGGGLVLHGEPGIGKTALLQYAADRAAGMRTLRAVGTEPEADLGYAGLDRLLRPVRDLITLLPPPQADALRTVLGMQDGAAPDRFLVGLGVLSLLSEAATDYTGRGPVLCMVDDSHWLDDATVAALGFVARRVEAEPIALLFALRGSARPAAAGLSGLPELPLSGLDHAAAGQLLDRRAPGRWSETARDATIRATGGNPLALIELPLADLSQAGLPAYGFPEHRRSASGQPQPGQLGSGQPGTETSSVGPGPAPSDPAPSKPASSKSASSGPAPSNSAPTVGAPVLGPGDPVPLSEELRRAFLDRLIRHDDTDRTLLLTIAAAGAVPSAVLVTAAERLGIADPADRLGGLTELIRSDDGELAIRHPLIRSACYGDADPTRLRAVHAALAEAWTGSPDRRAWHLGRAVDGVSEEAAADLERAGRAALLRSGPGTALALLTRAAELSESAAARDRRLLTAADAAVRAGDHDRSSKLLDLLARPGSEPGTPRTAAAGEAERFGEAGGPDPVELARLRGVIELRRGQPADALDLLDPALTEALTDDSLARDPDRVASMLMVYGEAAFQANRAEPYARVAAELERLALDDLAGPAGVLLRMLRGTCRARTGADAGLGPDDLAEARALADPYALCWAGGLLWGLGDPSGGRRLRHAAMRRARTLGAAGALAWVLDYVVGDELGDSRYDLAEAYAEEGRRFAEETGQPTTAARHLAWLALLASLRGRAEAVELAESALAAAERHRVAGAAAVARRALGLLHLAAGRPAEALRHLSALDRGDDGHPGIRLYNIADLVEAAVRADQPDRARASYQRYQDWIRSGVGPQLRGLGARCRALLSDGDAALAAYREAVELHLTAGQPFEEARTRLLHGEQLRRDRRPLDARAELRAAVEIFRRLGTRGWAERAATELRAAGGADRTAGPDLAPSHRPDPVTEGAGSALNDLSPQELRIAVGVGEGLTNREIAAQLFLSPRTVDYHLRKVFQKLKISSRAELIKLGHAAPS